MMKHFYSVVTLSSIFMCFASISGISAQNKITVSGTVTDNHGEPLAGVYVTDGKKGGQTDKNGKYFIENLKPGKTTLRSMFYSSFSQGSETILLQKDTTINFTLTEDALNLNEIVVTGTRTDRRLSETPVQTTLIKDREIKKAGSVSTLEALQDNVPGIVISPNAMGNNMRIKGLNSRYILFMIDGERMVSEGAGGNINLDQIDVNEIEKIEVINGAASALYGSNAVGAVINIITKKSSHKIEADAQVVGESNNTLRTRAGVDGKIGKVRTRLSGFRNASDGFGGDGEGPYAAKYQDWGANAKVTYSPTSQWDINATGRYFIHETYNPANSIDVVHPLAHNLNVGLSSVYRSKNNKNVGNLSVNWGKFLKYDFLELKKKTRKNTTADYISARLTDSYRFNEKLELISGAEYNHQEIFAVKTLGAEPTSKSIDDGSIFAQAEWSPVKDFDIVLGARYTYNAQFKSAFNPKLSLMYELGNFKFRGGVGTAFRAPDIKELYYDFDHQGMFHMYGNPNLKAEKGLYTSLSVEYTINNFNASVSGYYNDISNKISQYDVIDGNGQDNKYYENANSATLKGVDVNFTWIFLKQLTWKATYSFCDAKNNETGLQLSSNVRHSFTTSLTWNGLIANSPFSLQIAGRVNSPILYQSVTTDKDGNEVLEKEQSKAYNIWKMTLVKPFRIGKHTIEGTLKCDNLFNFKEESYINPGRQFLIGIRYAFK